MTGRTNSDDVRVECTDCLFSKTVEEDGRKPAEIIIDHGRERGHKLSVKT